MDLNDKLKLGDEIFFKELQTHPFVAKAPLNHSYYFTAVVDDNQFIAVAMDTLKKYAAKMTYFGNIKEFYQSLNRSEFTHLCIEPCNDQVNLGEFILYLDKLLRQYPQLEITVFTRSKSRLFLQLLRSFDRVNLFSKYEPLQVLGKLRTQTLYGRNIISPYIDFLLMEFEQPTAIIELECQILVFLARYGRQRDVADALNISPQLVTHYLNNISRKLHLGGKTEVGKLASILLKGFT